VVTNDIFFIESVLPHPVVAHRRPLLMCSLVPTCAEIERNLTR